jgi:exonuclease III
VALCSELNLNWKPPRFKGFISFQKKSKKKFHGLALYVSTHLSESVLRIPDEDEELEVIHVLLKCTTPNLNIIGCYLDVESRQDNSTVERVWTKLVSKVDIALGRGEGVILMGDLNRPLQSPRPSFGTKLLLDWEELGTMYILNNKDISTRIDPFTKKGSTLDFGVV